MFGVDVVLPVNIREFNCAVNADEFLDDDAQRKFSRKSDSGSVILGLGVLVVVVVVSDVVVVEVREIDAQAAVQVKTAAARVREFGVLRDGLVDGLGSGLRDGLVDRLRCSLVSGRRGCCLGDCLIVRLRIFLWRRLEFRLRFCLRGRDLRYEDGVLRKGCLAGKGNGQCEYNWIQDAFHGYLKISWATLPCSLRSGRCRSSPCGFPRIRARGSFRLRLSARRPVPNRFRVGRGRLRRACLRSAEAPIVPTKKYREPTKGTVEYEFAILVDGAWSTTEIDGKLLADPKAFATALSGKGAIIKDNKLLTSFIADAIAFNHDLPKFKSFNQTGWIDDACEEFAYPNGNFIIRREGKNYERIFKPKGDREAWKQKFVEVTEQGGAIANAIIGAAAAAPLVKLIDGVPNLQVHVHGRKSIGKTPMLKFAVSMFGDPNMDALTHAFSATPKYRLETACAFSGLPLICEELESIGKTNPETLSCDIYNYFLGVGGQALKRNGTSREPKLFTGTRFTSGEHSLVQSCGNGGEFKRVLELRCSSLLDEEFASDLYGFCNRNHGLFGEQWIQYIIKNRDIISKNYNQALKTILDTQRGKGGDENDITQLRTLVISVIAYQHFKICIGLQSLDTEDDANRMNREVGADLTAIIRMLPTVAEIDDTKRAIDFLKSFIAGSEKYFWRTIRDPDTGRKRDICHYTADGYGKLFENGEVAILPHALKMILEDKGHFKSAEKLIAEFSDKSYLCSMNGSYRYSSWIDGKTRKTIRFKAGILCGEERNEEQEMPLEETCASQ